jgi:FKBP-type peptidyl-prolyl cis-trans isomerase FklB
MLKLLLCAALAAAGDAEKKEGEEFLAANREKEGVFVLPSGLQYKVLRAGDGDSHPTADSPCEVHYEGTLINGDEFDSSYKRGSPTTFAPNQVIKGWTEAMQLMVEGDKWEMYIPYELAYGAGGSPPKIPGHSVLIFRMEILQVKGSKAPAVKCDPKTEKGCSEKDLTYLKKMEGKDIKAEKERLSKMTGSKMSPDQLSWVGRRIKLLTAKMKADEL